MRNESSYPPDRHIPTLLDYPPRSDWPVSVTIGWWFPPLVGVVTVFRQRPRLLLLQALGGEFQGAAVFGDDADHLVGDTARNSGFDLQGDLDLGAHQEIAA